MKQENIAFSAKVGTGQVYTKGGLLYQAGLSIGEIQSIYKVESNLNGEVFLVGWYLPQAIETNEQPSIEDAEAEGGS